MSERVFLGACDRGLEKSFEPKAEELATSHALAGDRRGENNGGVNTNTRSRCLGRMVYRRSRFGRGVRRMACVSDDAGSAAGGRRHRSIVARGSAGPLVSQGWVGVPLVDHSVG